MIRRLNDLNTNLNLKETNYYIINVCFCPQKRMSPPVPQTVVIGKKSIWVTNKIKLQSIKKKMFLIHETQNKFDQKC